MYNFITANQYDNQMMDDYVLRKYKENINNLCQSVNIFPSNYFNKSSITKRWHIYFFYYREGKRKKYHASSFVLNGQNIQVNRSKNHDAKIEQIELLKEATINELKTSPKFITSLIHGKEKAKELYPSVFGLLKIKEGIISIKNAFEMALEVKKQQVNNSTYISTRSVSNRFLLFIDKSQDDSIDLLSKTMFLDFLNNVLKTSSNINFNNSKGYLSAILTVLKDRDIVKENYLFSIKNRKTNPEKNKAFSDKQLKDVFKYLKANNKELYFYCLHVYYGLMRPITVNRLRVKDIDLDNKIFNTKTKTGDFVKIIPRTLFNEVYKEIELSAFDGNNNVFGYKELFTKWIATDENKRSRYTKLFRAVKDALKLDSEYTIYSFRHSAIGNMFSKKVQELKKENEPNYINKSIEFVRQFTNHKTNEQTKQYLRGITTKIHVDWSDYL